MAYEKEVFLKNPTHADKAEWNAKGYRVRPIELAPDDYVAPKAGKKQKAAVDVDESPAEQPAAE